MGKVSKRMLFDGIDADAVSQNFLEEIVGEMIRLHGVSESDAVGRIVEKWKGRKFRWPEGEPGSDTSWMIFHESPEHWAQVIFTGNWTWWRKNDER